MEHKTKQVKWHIKYRKAIILMGLITIIVFSPLFAFIKSIGIMFPFSLYEKKHSLLEREDIVIDMPGGISTLKKDWYPFVMVFNDDYGLSRQVGRDVNLTILYNFGAFDLLKGCATLYDEESAYLNAFYGAYIVKDETRPFGYNNDLSPNFDEMALVPSHDMRNLVLYSLGKKGSIFETSLDRYYKEETFLGIAEWDVMESTIMTNSPMHQYETDHQAYIQYGKPNQSLYNGVDFKEIELKGKIYCRYFPEKKVTIFFYILSPSEELIEYTDREFIRKTKLEIN